MAKIWWNKTIWHHKQIWLLIAVLFIVASPHLLISMSIMNAYSSLGIAAIIIGYLCHKYQKNKPQLQTLFFLYLTAAIITDVHHWYMAWQTSLPSKSIAEEIVRKTEKPVNKVYCILIRDDMPKFSSFCVPTEEAIGWGISVLAVTAYKCPAEIRDTTLERTPEVQQEARKLAQRIKKKYDCVWIINKENVEVIK